ncbi:hypothetical protein Scep_020052 [Stephania cephalantha]|uniref:Uncharacterized protein n=1 Tax=Stephania cephalantha TaxID=152367 RepID=A0AAP0ICD6_9MAGN
MINSKKNKKNEKSNSLLAPIQSDTMLYIFSQDAHVLHVIRVDWSCLRAC